MAVRTENFKIDCIKNLFECGICSRSYRDPTQAKCGHIFCKLCLEKLQETTDANYCCPVCNENLKSDGGDGVTKSRDDIQRLSEAFNTLVAAYQSDKQSIDTVFSEGPSHNTITIEDDSISEVQLTPESSMEEDANNRPGMKTLVVAKSMELVEEELSRKLISIPPPLSQDNLDSVGAVDIFNGDSHDVFPNFTNGNEAVQVPSSIETPLDLTVTLSSSQIICRDTVRRPKSAFQCVSPSIALDLSSRKRKADDSEELHTKISASALCLQPKLKICVRNSLYKEFLNRDGESLPGKLSQHPYIPKISSNRHVDQTKMLESPRHISMHETAIGGNMKGDQILEKEKVKNPISRPKSPSFDGNLNEMTYRPDKIITEFVNVTKNVQGTKRKSPSPKDSPRRIRLDKNNGPKSIINSPAKVPIAPIVASYSSSTTSFNNDESNCSEDSFLCSTQEREVKSFSMNKPKVTVVADAPAQGKVWDLSIGIVPNTVTMIPGTDSTTCFSPLPAMIEKDILPANVTIENGAVPREDEGDAYGNDLYTEDFVHSNGLFFGDSEMISDGDAAEKTEPQPLQLHNDDQVQADNNVNVVTVVEDDARNNNIVNCQSTESKYIQSTAFSATLIPNSTSKKFVFCPTRLHRQQLAKLTELCDIFGGTVSKDYSEDVSHLIMNLESNHVPQTMKYLASIAGKKWIVVFDWVDECLRQNKLISELPYEASNRNFPQCDEGVRISRLSKNLLFERYSFHVSGNLKSSGASAEDWENLLKKLGGNVIYDANRVTKDVLIIGDCLDRLEIYQDWLKSHGCITLAWEWILDCVICYSVLPLTKSHYLLTKLNETERLAVSTPELFQFP